MFALYDSKQIDCADNLPDVVTMRADYS